MDRQTIYAGQVPLETDLLGAQQKAMIALAEFSQTVLGTATLVDSFTVTPTTPASLNVILTPGTIYQLENIEGSTWSSLPANTSAQIMKQGVGFVPTGGGAPTVGLPATIGITPPGTVGFSQVFLVQVQYEDFDSGATVLPYFNASNPSAPFSGPGNAGTAQNTVRYGGVAYQVKAGTAATTGTQVAPAPDAGWTGLYLITVANGATSVSSGNITLYSGAPFLATNGKLPQIPTGVQNETWTYAQDTGTANSIVASISPAPLALTPGLKVNVKVANSVTGASTFNLNGLGNVAIHRANGAATQNADINASQVVELTYDGSAWQITNYIGVASSTTNVFNTVNLPYCTDSSGAANSIIASFSPAITSLSAGNIVEVKLANSVTGATTITVNALAPINVKRFDGNPLRQGDAFAGEVLLLEYDGTNFQLVNSTEKPSPFSSTYCSTFSRHSLTLSVPNNTVTAVPFNTSSIGTDNDVSLVSGKCQIVTAGRYVMFSDSDSNFTGTNPGGAYGGIIIVNGSNVVNGTGVLTTSPQLLYVEGCAFYLADLNIGDQVQVGVLQESGVTLTPICNATLTICKVNQ